MGEKFQGSGVAVGESSAELPDDEGVGEIAQFSERELVLDFITQECSATRMAGVRPGCDGMKMMPVSERPAELRVGEMMVPEEAGDLRFPSKTGR